MNGAVYKHLMSHFRNSLCLCLVWMQTWLWNANSNLIHDLNIELALISLFAQKCRLLQFGYTAMFKCRPGSLIKIQNQSYIWISSQVFDQYSSKILQLNTKHNSVIYECRLGSAIDIPIHYHNRISNWIWISSQLWDRYSQKSVQYCSLKTQLCLNAKLALGSTFQFNIDPETVWRQISDHVEYGTIVLYST